MAPNGIEINARKLGLRFDKGATRLLERLLAAANEVVPNGMRVALTITAPIHLRAKTGAVLEDKIKALVGKKSSGRDERHIIHGNRVRIRVIRDAAKRSPKFIGFVHNPDSDPLLLLDMAGTASAERRK